MNRELTTADGHGTRVVQTATGQTGQIVGRWHQGDEYGDDPSGETWFDDFHGVQRRRPVRLDWAYWVRFDGETRSYRIAASALRAA